MKKLYLYSISQTEKARYDTYDSVVVCASDRKTALNTNPNNGKQMTADDWSKLNSSWCSSIDSVNIKCIGTATNTMKTGIVCASFNAG